jgi:hypothetical protein
MAGWRWPPSPGTGPAGSWTRPAARSGLWTAREPHPRSGLWTPRTAHRSRVSLKMDKINKIE